MNRPGLSERPGRAVKRSASAQPRPLAESDVEQIDDYLRALERALRARWARIRAERREEAAVKELAR